MEPTNTDQDSPAPQGAPTTPTTTSAPARPNVEGMTTSSKVLVGLFVATILAIGTFFILDIIPGHLLFWQEEQLDEVDVEGLGADIYEAMSAEVGATATANIPDVNPLVEVDPYAEYQNPFE